MWARPSVADGGDGLKVAANVSNKHSRTVDRGWPSDGWGANNSSP